MKLQHVVGNFPKQSLSVLIRTSNNEGARGLVLLGGGDGVTALCPCYRCLIQISSCFIPVAISPGTSRRKRQFALSSGLRRFSTFSHSMPTYGNLEHANQKQHWMFQINPLCVHFLSAGVFSMLVCVNMLCTFLQENATAMTNTVTASKFQPGAGCSS